ncbi:U-box domain-containing protein 33-like [Nymphaea colorata]|nr:U-box domain-containing protein 33-like [Nymphaea colorata]
MDIVRRQRDIMAEVENLASEKSALESLVAETTTQLVETSEKLQEVRLALDVAEKEKSEMQKQKDDVVQALAQMLREKLEMQEQRDDAIKEMEELRRDQAAGTMRFSQAELEEATNNFDRNLIVGKGGVGTVYKARLHHTAVAIKRLNVDRLPCGHEMDWEVGMLCRMRHPHFVTLLGCCSDLRAFIFEYLENGNLDYQMDASPSLTWQSRIRIAAEICDGLLFLHSFDVAHTNLKPSNILLDPNLVAKIDLGFCSPCNNSDPGDWDPMGSWAYIDPETHLGAPHECKSDVYSFGVILLQLLTGRPALLIADDIQHEVNRGKLEEVLDQRAGQWPFEQALRLANLALRCCCESSRLRPDLESDIWPVLNAMRMRFSESSAANNAPEASRQPPHHFLCPITQDIMNDPHMAADGYTYEKEAIEVWLNSGHNTSPMTNLPLSHSNLTPNLALRSAIRQWLDRV